MGSGLDGWKNLARSIRQATRGGANYPPFNNATIIDSSKLGSYYTGAGIIAAILIISLFFSLVGGIGQCGVWICCKGMVRRKQDRMKSKSPPSFRVKICMLIWIVLIYLFFCVGAFTSYTGGAVLGNSVVSLGPVGVGLLNSSGALINNTIPSAKTWFSSLILTVGQGVDNSSSFVSSKKLVTDGVTPALDNLASTMTSSGTGAQSLIDSGNSIASFKSSASALIQTMITDISTINSTIAGWQSGITLSSGGIYTPSNISSSFSNPDPSVLASTANSNLNAASNVPSFLTSIASTPSACSICALAVQNASNSMPSLVTQRVVSQGSGVKANLQTTLGKTESDLINSLVSMRDSANVMVNSGISSMNSFSSSATNYNDIRNTIMIIMSTIILIILLVISVFGYRKNPKAMKGCNLVSTPVYAVVQLLAVLMFILAIVFGDICSSVFDYTPAPILSGLNDGLYDGVNNILLLRDQCSANYSMLTVAVNMKLVSAESIDTTQLCSSAINAVDFSPLGNINLASLVVFSPDPATILSPLKNLDLSQLNASSLNTLVNTTLPALNSSLIAISAALNASTIGSTVNIAAATSDYTIKKETVNSKITSYTKSGGLIDQISTTATLISAGILSLPGKWATVNASSYGPATSYYSQAQTNMGKYQDSTSADLLAAIPTIKSNIKSQIADASTILYSNLNCTGIGASLYSFQDAVCGQFLGGLDILWLAYGVIAVSAACSMPVLIWISNRLFYNSLKYVNLAQSPTQVAAPRSSFFQRGLKIIPVADSSKTSKINASVGREASIIKSFPAPISPSMTSKPILPVYNAKPKKK